MEAILQGAEALQALLEQRTDLNKASKGLQGLMGLLFKASYLFVSLGESEGMSGSVQAFAWPTSGEEAKELLEGQDAPPFVGWEPRHLPLGCPGLSPSCHSFQRECVARHFLALLWAGKPLSSPATTERLSG